MGKPTGMRAFMIVWAGQVASLLGSAMTQFALTIWAYQLTGSATALGLVAFFGFAPMLVFGPVAGALVDRWNRKLVMMLSDLGAGVSTVAIFLLYLSGGLQIWHVCVAAVVSGVFAAFQWPAYSAAISTMLPKEQYARANGLLGLADSVSGVLAPIFALGVLGVFGSRGVLMIDIITFVLAVGALLVIHVPQPERTETGAEAKGSLWKESIYGFHYIGRRPSLLGLQITFLFINLTISLAFTILAPMLLARTSTNQGVLATVQSFGALGGVIGGLILSAWGGPRRRIYAVLLGIVSLSVMQIILGMGQQQIFWIIGMFGFSVVIPILNGSSQALWQSKVAPDVQGRVFAARRMMGQFTKPLAMLMAGPLADYFFEPAMQKGRLLAPFFGSLVGTGPGAGMALMFVIFGVCGIWVGIAGFAIPVVREVEDLLPDHSKDKAKEKAQAPA
jgi:DHA3 family macrolide efflux protein-like MFS transporter